MFIFADIVFFVIVLDHRHALRKSRPLFKFIRKNFRVPIFGKKIERLLESGGKNARRVYDFQSIVKQSPKNLLLGFGSSDPVNLGIFVLQRTSEKRVEGAE